MADRHPHPSSVTHGDDYADHLLDRLLTEIEGFRDDLMIEIRGLRSDLAATGSKPATRPDESLGAGDVSSETVAVEIREPESPARPRKRAAKPPASKET